MRRQQEQEGYRPPVAETQVEEPEVSEEVSKAEEAKMPSIAELDALLRGAESVATVASMSEKEIDEMLEWRQKALAELQELEVTLESRLREEAERFPELKPSDYERLVEEGMLEKSYAERLQKLDEMIAQLASLDYPPAEAIAELEKLSEVRAVFREQLEKQIAERQQEEAARREEERKRLLEEYCARVAELERTIAEIESNPRVMERLQSVAAKEMQEFFAKREAEKRAFEEKIEQERRKNLREADRYIQSLSARQMRGNRRLGEIVGNEKIGEVLLEALEKGNREERQRIFDGVLDQLEKAIILGEGEKQLKDPAEVVPWEMKPTSLPFIPTLDELRYMIRNVLEPLAEGGDTTARKLLERALSVLRTHEAQRRLYRKWEWGEEVDPKTKKKKKIKRLSRFYAAFDTRKKNDEAGITAARKKEREEAAKREAAFLQAAQEIVERGGFIVEAPITKIVRGKRVEVGRQKVAVRLEKRKSNKDNDYWAVVELLSATGEQKIGGLKIGSVSPLNMISFPEWFRLAAGPYFRKQGEDFVERLQFR